MKWEQDLVVDIRTGDEDLDNQDLPFDLDGLSWSDISSDQGIKLALDKFMSVRDHTRSILEIGVNQFGFTGMWTGNKHPGTMYVGIDIEDRSAVHNPEKLIWTIHDSSSNVEDNIKRIQDLGIKEFDFIFIDGWHSINQMLTDWEYTSLLSANGIIGLHDTNYHPGPKMFSMALDRERFQVEEPAPETDWGVVFVRPL